MVLEGVIVEVPRVVLVKDCVAASGSFVLHGLLKKLLLQAATEDGARVVFVALNASFSHYARVARKQGCNLVACKEKGHLIFLDLFSDPNTWKPQDGAVLENPLFLLFKRIREAVRSEPGAKNTAYIMIDDVALLEVIAQGSKNRVLDFLHYCRALPTGGQGKKCSLVMLIHEDIYADDESSTFLRELEHSSNVTIQVEPLSTGHSADVHGQISVGYRDPMSSKHNSNERQHFKVGENSVAFFAPGQHPRI